MKPIRLYIKNFMNHIESDLNFENINIALIIGKNKNNDRESNGLGKTTIFSAIEYVLFGEVPTSILEKVIKDNADKCLVEFDFETTDGIFRIIRGRSKKGRSELKLKQKINDKWESICQRSMTETAEKLHDIIKITHKAFRYSVLFAQGDLEGLSSASKLGDRRAIFKEPLNLIKYTKLEKIILNKIKPLKQEIDKLNTTIDVYGNIEADIAKTELDLKQYNSSLLDKEEKIFYLKKTITEKKGQQSDLKRNINESDYNMHEQILELEERLNQSKSKIDRFNKDIENTNSKIKNNILKISEFKNKIDKIKANLSFALAKDVKPVTELSKSLEDLLKEELILTKELAQYEAQYDQANKNLPKENKCQACLQPITEEHREKCKVEVDKILAEKTENISNIKLKLNNFLKNKTKIKLELSESRKKDSDIEMFNGYLERDNTSFEMYNKIGNELHENLVNIQARLEHSKKEFKDINDRLISLKELAAQSSISEINKKIIKLSEEILILNQTFDNNQDEISKLKGIIASSEEKLLTYKQNLKKVLSLKDKLKSYQYKYKIHKMVHGAFCSSGIPTFIIHSVLDELQIETNFVLSKIRSDLELKFDKDLEIYYKVCGADRDYDQLSIGQKFFIAFSLKLGMSKIIQRKLGIDIRFLELDEVDQSLDKAGVDAYAEILKKWSEDFIIFVITHNDDLKDKFSHTILVEGDLKNGVTSSLISNW